MTDESSQNSVTSDKAQNGTNGDHKKAESVVIEDDDEDYDVQEFSEPEELVIDEDEPEEEDTADEDVKEEVMDVDEDKDAKTKEESKVISYSEFPIFMIKLPPRPRDRFSNSPSSRSKPPPTNDNHVSPRNQSRWNSRNVRRRHRKPNPLVLAKVLVTR